MIDTRDLMDHARKEEQEKSMSEHLSDAECADSGPDAGSDRLPDDDPDWDRENAFWDMMAERSSW